MCVRRLPFESNVAGTYTIMLLYFCFIRVYVRERRYVYTLLPSVQRCENKTDKFWYLVFLLVILTAQSLSENVTYVYFIRVYAYTSETRSCVI